MRMGGGDERRVVTWYGRVWKDDVEFWVTERISSEKSGWPQASCLLLVSCSWLLDSFCFSSSNLGNSLCFLGALARILPSETWIQELSGFLEHDCLLLFPWLYKKEVGSWNGFFPTLERLHWETGLRVKILGGCFLWLRIIDLICCVFHFSLWKKGEMLPDSLLPKILCAQLLSLQSLA